MTNDGGTVRSLGAAAIVVFLGAILLPPASAQSSATLRVLTISETDGNPVPAANVLLTRIVAGENGEAYGGVTSDRGLEEIGGLPGGQYRLAVSHVSHRPYRDTINLGPGDRRLERITLQVQTRQVEELVVRDERHVASGKAGIRRVTQHDVEQIPSAVGGVLPYLRSLPSVEMAGSRGGNLHIRGGKPSQNKVLIDNIPVVKPFHISNIYSPIPSGLLNEMTVYAGGFGAEYRGKSSSVIDIGLRPGNMKKIAGSATVSPQLASIQVEGPVVEGRQSLLLSARRSLVARTSEFLPQDETNIEFYDLFGRYSLLREDISCNLTGIITRDNGKIDPSKQNNISWSNRATGINCLGFSPEFASHYEFSAGYSSFSNLERKEGRTVRESNMDRYFLNINVRNENIKSDIEYGFSLNADLYEATLDEYFADIERIRSRSAILGGHLSYTRHVGDTFDVNPSLAVQLPIVDATPTLEPRLRLEYYLTSDEAHKISVAGGRYTQLSYGYTDARDVSSTFTLLRPYKDRRARQTALHGIIGYGGEVTSTIGVDVEAFVKRHDNMLVSEWTPVIGGTVETSSAQSDAFGADARIRYQSRNLYAYVGYGWSTVQYKAASEDLGAWIERPVFEYSPGFDRRHKLNAVLSYQVGSYATSVRWAYGSGRPYTRVYGFDLSVDVPGESPTEESGTGKIFYDRPYGARLPPFHRLDLSVEGDFKMSSGVSLESKVGVLNAYNRENIFYLNHETLRATDQISILPYVSLEVAFNQ
mgnify:CR=1 FL=1